MNTDQLIENFKPLVYPYSGSGMLTNDRDDSVIQHNAEECAKIAQRYYKNDGGTFIDYKYFCEEINCTNVESITYDKEIDKWVIKYKNGLASDSFRHFHEAIEFIFLESSQE